MKNYSSRLFTGSNEKLISGALLVARVALGIVLFAHGSQKVLGIFGGKGLEGTVAAMSQSTPIPAWLFYVSAFAEFLGGIGVFFGLLTRFWALALVINMSVAVLQVHAPNGFFLPLGLEYPATLAMLALSILLAGPGAYSLDAILFGNPTRITRPTP